MITFGELSTRWAGVVISIVLVLVVLIAILFVMSVAEKLSRKEIIQKSLDNFGYILLADTLEEGIDEFS